MSPLKSQASGTTTGGGGGADACLFASSGESALTTILILGLNSDSYCTQRAATAASCRNKVQSSSARKKSLTNSAHCEETDLSNSFWRILVLQSWVYTLFHFILAQPWSCLQQQHKVQQITLPLVSHTMCHCRVQKLW